MTLARNFTADDIPVLRGMASVHRGDENPYQSLIDIIEKCGTIRVWTEY